MVSVLTMRAVDRGFEPSSGQTKDYEILISWFSAKHAALRKKSKDWLVQNQDGVSEWDNMLNWSIVHLILLGLYQNL